MIWLVSRRFDLAIFGLPALVALGFVALEPVFAPDGALSLPLWVITVVLVDVAHVWSTLYRTYLDPVERSEHLRLYVGVPIAVYAVGALLYMQSAALFWTCLAYAAVFHFVRQQYGWVALYNRKASVGRLDRWIDRAAIYAATLCPLLWWHANLPRNFDWFLPGDFVQGLLAPQHLTGLWLVYVAALAAFAGRQLVLLASRRPVQPGKVLVVSTTAACWGLGIVATNSDWAFTVTNVFIHGVPYMAYVYWHGHKQDHPRGTLLGFIFAGRRVSLFLAGVMLLAIAEEGLWDTLIWHDHPELFGLSHFELAPSTQALVVPLLALPQGVHYVLDAFIWRRRHNRARTSGQGAETLDAALGLRESG